MLTGLGRALLARQMHRGVGGTGLAGMAAGLAFNLLLKRSPLGALAWGGAVIARKAYRSVQAKRDAATRADSQPR